ncbi:unnamed protein product [Alternaria alternata]
MIGKDEEPNQEDYLNPGRFVTEHPANTSNRRLSVKKSMNGLDSPLPQVREVHEDFLKEANTWLNHERAKRAARRVAQRAGHKGTFQDHGSAKSALIEGYGQPVIKSRRSGSESSEGSVALDQLAGILEKAVLAKAGNVMRNPSHDWKLSVGSKSHAAGSKDLNHLKSVIQLVPTCDIVLDNSKIMAYSVNKPAGSSGSKHDTTHMDTRAQEEKDAWRAFSFEILHLAHKLNLKGWRKIPMDQCDKIEVRRLSGAMTNAVYTVTPPEYLHSLGAIADDQLKPKSTPAKLLLRIYGPNIEKLIDRDNEMRTLERLARKGIGPCLLGTFSNGRFEEFLHARPLTAEEIRIPETSKQIAQRIRELHSGIDLLQEEREAGPSIWQKWDNLVDHCEQVVTWLDRQIFEDKQVTSPSPSPLDDWRKRGFVCGTKWPTFRRVIERYRKWLEEQYGGADKINEQLVFAHNDTQYGNILRVEPDGNSPLLLPANLHKQLMVIDFEYANANLPAMEFANHFTEWMYNYHAPKAPWRYNDEHYPTPEEQHRFIQAYVTHISDPKVVSVSMSRKSTSPLESLPSSDSDLTSNIMPEACPLQDQEDHREEQEAEMKRDTEDEIQRLMAETRLWRLASSVVWIAWGIVQASIPGLPNFDTEEKNEGGTIGEESRSPESSITEVKAGTETKEVNLENSRVSKGIGRQKDVGTKTNTDQNVAISRLQDGEEFDYLAYAQNRAMFAWGDAIRLGFVKAEELPDSVRERAKIVHY